MFMGTPDFAVPALEQILRLGHQVSAVYTQPPRAAGRGLAERPSPVQLLAQQRGLAVRTPASLRSPAELAAITALGADVGVVVAYGLLLPKPVLDTPRFGCLNVHASLLPRWRGAAPIQRAIMAGDPQTGVTIMRMEEGLDTGPMCLKEPVPIAPGTTAGDLHDELAVLGARLLGRALGDLERGQLHCTPQPESGATYAKKIDKAESHIDFGRSTDEVLNQIHGLSPVPGAWCALRVDGATIRVKILKAEPISGSGAPGLVLDDELTIACRDGAIRPLLLQREGKAAMDRSSFLRGLAVQPGTMLA